jgi:hypothetical protein
MERTSQTSKRLSLPPEAKYCLHGDHSKPQTYEQQQNIWLFKFMTNHETCVQISQYISEPSSTAGIAQ